MDNIYDLYKKHNLPEFVELRNCRSKFILEVIQTESARVFIFSDRTVSCVLYNLDSSISLELIRGLSQSSYEGVSEKASAALSEWQGIDKDKKLQGILRDVRLKEPGVREAIYKELQKEFGPQRLFTIE